VIRDQISTFHNSDRSGLIDVFTRPIDKDCIMNFLDFCLKNKENVFIWLCNYEVIIFISLYNQKTVNYPAMVDKIFVPNQF
jgi:hypothetical protein